MLWSILIPTLIQREGKFMELLGSLLPQCERSPAPVEVVALQNAGQESLARYRNRLLQNARGQYVSFVDDDDEVMPDYVDEIVPVLLTGPDVVGITQVCSGLPAPLTFISLRYGDRPGNQPPQDTPRGPAYLRAFSHMCPVLASIARQGSFLAGGDLYSGEDIAYVDSVLPFLHERGDREVVIDKPLYHYRWSGKDANHGLPPSGLAVRAMKHKRPLVSSPCFRWCP